MYWYQPWYGDRKPRAIANSLASQILIIPALPCSLLIYNRLAHSYHLLQYALEWMKQVSDKLISFLAQLKTHYLVYCIFKFWQNSMKIAQNPAAAFLTQWRTTDTQRRKNTRTFDTLELNLLSCIKQPSIHDGTSSTRNTGYQRTP